MKTKKRKPRTWTAWAAAMQYGGFAVKQSKAALRAWFPSCEPFRVRVTEIKRK